MSSRKSSRTSRSRARWVVRPARDSDATAVERLRCEGFKEHARRRPDFFRAEAQLPPLPGEDGPDRAVLVAVSASGEAEPAGVAIVTRHFRSPGAWMKPLDRAYLDELVVDPSLRRKGIGRLLVDEACAWARRAGARQIVLTAWMPSRATSRFYDRVGFGVVSQIRAASLE